MGLSKPWIACAACGVCVVVVLAVMVPVSIFVLAPSMGQHALDVSTMTISKATVSNLTDVKVHPDDGEITNQIILEQDSLPFGATLAETQMVMHFAAGVGGMGPYDATNVAWFNMPEQSIGHGTNSFSTGAQFHILYPETFVNFGFGFLFGNPNINISIVGKPKLTTLGFISMELKLGKKFNCTNYDDLHPPTTPEPSSEPADDEFVAATARRLQFPPIALACDEIRNLDKDEIDSIWDSFQYDLVRTTTTTTTAPWFESNPNVGESSMLRR